MYTLVLILHTTATQQEYQKYSKKSNDVYFGFNFTYDLTFAALRYVRNIIYQITLRGLKWISCKHFTLKC